MDILKQNKIYKNYFKSSFYDSFYPLFLSLFFLTSMVFFIKISSLTSYIELTFFDLGLMYTLLLPKIILYTMPVSFFLSLALGIAKLSKENETLVYFSLGITSKKFAKIFFKISLIFSFVLFVNNLYLVPSSNILYKNFISKKKLDAKLNIKPTEFGQKFGEWLVFVQKVEKNRYKSIVMFSNKENKIINAEEAFIKNSNAQISLSLKTGKIFSHENENFQEIKFQNLDITTNEQLKIDQMNIYTYFANIFTNDDYLGGAIFHFIMAIFPLVSYLLAISLGMFNFRYEKGNIYLYSLSFITLFLVVSKNSSENMQYYALLIIPISYILSKYIFHKKIVKKY